MKMKDVLIVEDDQNLGTLLSDYLKAKGYENTLCRNGEEGYEAFKNGHYDICILDIMMPLKDGFTLAKEIRGVDKEIPLLFLTAKSMKEDVIEGFRIGADDYIKKPFSMDELLMRIKAILRRVPDKKAVNPVFDIGQYKFDHTKQLLSSGKKKVKLTAKENDLLLLLCKNINQVVDRNAALKSVWNDDSYFNSRSMDVFIARLRKHLKEDPSIEIITARGYGFKLLVNKESGDL